MRKVFLTIAILAMPNWASAGVPALPNRATREEVREVKVLRETLASVGDLSRRGVLTGSQARSCERAFYAAASRLTHRRVSSLSEIDAFLAERPDASPMSDNFLIFTTILFTFAAILFVIGIASIFYTYWAVLPYLLPPAFYEVAGYVTCAALIRYAGALGIRAGLDPIWFVFPACLGLFPCLWITYFLHFRGAKNNPFKYGLLCWCNDKDSEATLDFTAFSSIVCAVIWGAVAVRWQSDLIAFIATIAMMSFLGFSIAVAPFCLAIGYTDEDKIPRAMTASFLVLLLGVAMHISRSYPPGLRYFEWSFIWLGTFVYYSSLLIVANKWYSKERYWTLMLLAVISGIAALYVGSVYNIGLLQKMGGTFFFLWVIEKYFEIPWQRKQWAWCVLLASVLLYSLASFAQQHPQYFLIRG